MLTLRVVGRFGEGHEAAQANIWQAGDFPCKSPGLFGCDSLFARFSADVDLQAEVQQRHIGGALLRESPGMFQ